MNIEREIPIKFEQQVKKDVILKERKTREEIQKELCKDKDIGRASVVR
jgi:hypothetical protein